LCHCDIYVVPGTETALPVESLLPGRARAPPMGSDAPSDEASTIASARMLPILARVAGYEIDGESKRTAELTGTTFVQAVKVPYKSGFPIIFAFVVRACSSFSWTVR
jgi:hypothetical protein